VTEAVLARLEASHRSGEDSVSLIFGFYEDDYAYLAEGWRFQRRRYIMQFRNRMKAAKLQLVEGLGLGSNLGPRFDLLELETITTRSCRAHRLRSTRTELGMVRFESERL
jgi:hypothetical protein